MRNFFFLIILVLQKARLADSADLFAVQKQVVEGDTKNAPREWTMEAFPEPEFGLVSDPDGFLSEKDMTSISEKIEVVTETAAVPLHIAIAVASKMKLPYMADVDEEKIAGEFAVGLHDRWGVGSTSDSGGTGVLIFLSVYDRVLYISRGGSFDGLLRDSRIDSVIKELKPSLRQAKYAEGLNLAVELLADFIEKGEPTWKEWIWDYAHVELGILGFYAFCIIYSIRKSRRQREEQRIYAEAASLLSEIDRSQAEALQGQYQATSCPVCLEDFVSDRVGSDDLPIKLLRCGHVFDETCWAEWVNSGQGNVSKCPICKKDVGSTEVSVTNADQARPVGGHVHEDTRDDNRAVQLFQQERNFRLTRLALRYPNYITQNQVQRWSSPTYNGSLARDQSFAESRPRVVEQRHQRASRGGGSSGAHFGGGTSSGGRGGRF